MSAFVGIPGAGGAGWFWHLVNERLGAAGHETLAVDLPADDEDAGLAAYADAVVAAADGLDGPLVLVAQSLGAFTAPLVLDRLDVRAIVFLNAMIPAPGETAGAWWENVGQDEAFRALALAQGRDPEKGFDLEEVFLHDVPRELWAAGEEHNREQSMRPFSDVGLGVAGWPDGVALHALGGEGDRLFPVGLQLREAHERLGSELEVLPGGHLNALSQPDAVAAALLRV